MPGENSFKCMHNAASELHKGIKVCSFGMRETHEFSNSCSIANNHSSTQDSGIDTQKNSANGKQCFLFPSLYCSPPFPPHALSGVPTQLCSKRKTLPTPPPFFVDL